VAVFVKTGSAGGMGSGGTGLPHRFRRNAAARAEKRNDKPVSAAFVPWLFFMFAKPPLSQALPATLWHAASIGFTGIVNCFSFLAAEAPSGI